MHHPGAAISPAAPWARSLGSPAGGAEHLFLGMLHDDGWPVNVISGLVDLGRVEAAVLDILRSPGYAPPPPPRFLVREGYVRMWGAEVAWIQVIGQGDRDSPALTREVLNTALASLNRPAPDSPASSSPEPLTLAMDPQPLGDPGRRN